MISGPGCPVCVTPNSFLDRAIALSRLPDVIIGTFGDLLRVPASSTSLAKERANGGDIRIVYSPLDALQIAIDHPNKRVVFLGVGFETTAPTVAATLLEAYNRKISNFLVLAAARVMPPAMTALLSSKGLRVDGFLCPGHVSAVIGVEPYMPLVENFKAPCVIAGFEPVDIMQGVLMLLEQIANKTPKVEVAYRRAVPFAGNPKAREIMAEVLEATDAEWRGLGILPMSGLAIREKYSAHDASRIVVEVEPVRENPGCACGSVLRGMIEPRQCPLFGKVCTPDSPVGACMVSTEGTCAAAFKYGEEIEAN
jgi:hydrogenase expression/formation protein HypD